MKALNLCMKILKNQIVMKLQNQNEYLDNFKIYFKAFKHKEILKEIIVIILGILTFLFYKYFTLLAIKYLTPVHIVFTTPIYFLFQKFCLIIYTVFSEESVFIVNNKIKK